MQVLITFFGGITLAYQMPIESSIKGNFNNRNPEDAVRLIENLASCSSAMDTDFKRWEPAAALWKEKNG